MGAAAERIFNISANEIRGGTMFVFAIRAPVMMNQPPKVPDTIPDQYSPRDVRERRASKSQAIKNPASAGFLSIWCPGEDSNLHGFTR